MGSAPYTVVAPDSPVNTKKYHELAEEYWNWVQGADPDRNPTNPNDANVTFLRDDIIGNQIPHNVGISRSQHQELQPFRNRIDVKSGTSVFFPIYHVCSVKGHPYVKGGTCQSLEDCKDAANIDLSNCYDQWARIKVNDGGEEDIADLKNHFIENDKFKLVVPASDKLNKEEGFSLAQGNYEGVVAGTYVYLTDVQPGKYVIDFGGRATDFHSRSLYDVTVK